MSGKVWMSSVLTPQGLGNKQGSHTKFFNRKWNPARFEIPTAPEEVYQAYQRHMKGFVLQRTDFPEAIAVFDEKRFSKIKDLFYIGPFLGVKGKLAEVLSRFDLGEGGLIPFTIYQADLVTPYPGKYFLLNFGCRKNSLLPEQCEDAKKAWIDKDTKRQIWDINWLKPKAEVVVHAKALEGPDLWFEEAVYDKIFMKDALAQAINDIGMGDIFKFHECKVLEDAQ
jgi:hypothetical protein